MVAIGHQCLPGTFYINISGSILHSAKARHGHCWSPTQPVALASAMNLFSSDMTRMLHPRLIWLGSASVLFLLILKWGATLSCRPKDIWSRGIGTGLAQVAQGAAHVTALCFQEPCCLPHSPLCPQTSQHP